jgi:hypothetical protein
MGQQGVHECPFPIARRRMHHEARWFIQHDQVLILVQNRERDRLRFRRRGHRLGNQQSIDSPGTRRFGRLGDKFAVARQSSLAYQRLDARAGDRADLLGQQSVDPLTCLRV